jgi:FKBP-type peptidyl-prolyl cis-trans isomerase SlyD
MKIENGKKVKLDVTISVDGNVIESAATRGGPVEYVHGEQPLPLGLEEKFLGLEPGDEREGEITFDMPQVEMKRSEFPKDFKVEKGVRFMAKREGQDVELELCMVTDDVVTVRPFHPLSGKTLKYQVKILEVKNKA